MVPLSTLDSCAHRQLWHKRGPLYASLQAGACVRALSALVASTCREGFRGWGGGAAAQDDSAPASGQPAVALQPGGLRPGSLTAGSRQGPRTGGLSGRPVVPRCQSASCLHTHACQAARTGGRGGWDASLREHSYRPGPVSSGMVPVGPRFQLATAQRGRMKKVGQPRLQMPRHRGLVRQLHSEGSLPGGSKICPATRRTSGGAQDAWAGCVSSSFQTCQRQCSGQSAGTRPSAVEDRMLSVLVRGRVQFWPAVPFESWNSAARCAD